MIIGQMEHYLTIITDVTIPSTASHQPVVYNSIIGICRNITINPGSSLTINNGGTLNISGNLNINSNPDGTINNSGVITLSGNINNTDPASLGSGELIFNGTTAQNISGDISLGKLTLNNSFAQLPIMETSQLILN